MAMRVSTRPAGTHGYDARLVWDGNRGAGTSGYADYDRDYRILVAGKPPLAGSADAVFRGDPTRHNPEDLFLAGLAACHLLCYLALCARHGVRVVAYEDDVRGTLALQEDGGGRFTEITLRPVVTLMAGDDAALALRLHDTAHARCFLANSCSVPIRCEPVIRSGGGGPDAPAGTGTGDVPPMHGTRMPASESSRNGGV